MATIVHVPIGINIIFDGSINFSGSEGPDPYWMDSYDVAPGTFGNLTLNNGNLIVIDSLLRPHSVFRYSKSISIVGYYKLKIVPYSDPGEFFKIDAILGGTTVDINVTPSPILQIIDINAITISQEENKRLILNVTPDIVESELNRTTYFNLMELWETVPIDDPTNFISTFVSSSHIDLSWQLYGYNFVMIAWIHDLDTFGFPDFGTPHGIYNNNDEINIGGGGGVVKFSGINETHSDTSIPAPTDGTTRYYKIWTWKQGDDNIRYYSDGVECFIIGNPRFFYASAPSSTQIDLVWVDNKDNNDVLLVSGSTIGTPADNINYEVGDTIPDGGTVLYKGNDGSFSDIVSNPFITYNYKLWSKSNDTSGPGTTHRHYSPGLEISIIPINPIDNPEPFTAISVTDDEILISWGLNGDSNNILLASGTTDDFGATLSGPYSVGDSLGNSDSTILLYDSNNLIHNDGINVLPPYTIYYKIWSKVSDNYSDGTIISITVGSILNAGGFFGGTFYYGYFSGDWYSGRWVDGFFLSGATWNSSLPIPSDNPHYIPEPEQGGDVN